MQHFLTFDPSGDWLVTTHQSDAAFWALDESLPRVLAGHQATVLSLAFAPDGKTLVSASHDGTVRVWPLEAQPNRESHVLLQGSPAITPVSVDSASRNVIVQDAREWGADVLAIPLAGGRPRVLFRCERGCSVVAPGDGGRLVATTAGPSGPIEDRWVIRIHDVEAGTLEKVEPAGKAQEEADSFKGIQFLGRRQLLASHGDKGLFLCDLAEGRSRILEPKIRGRFALSRNGEFVLGLTTGLTPGLLEARELIRFNLDGSRQKTLQSHGAQVTAVALDPTDTLVATGSADGTVRIGPVSGEEPYLFLRHKGRVWWVAFSPDGRWLASAGNDTKIILWPVPDLSKDPLHKRPHQEVLTWLRSKTNLRAVPDPASSTGWKLDRDPFPGWAKRPEP
jgi:WD40 repeat protein